MDWFALVAIKDRLIIISFVAQKIIIIVLHMSEYFDHFNKVLVISILSCCITFVCGLPCKSCSSICPSEILPTSASFPLYLTKHHQFFHIVTFMPGNVTKILEVLLYSCIKESGSFSSFKQDTLVGPFGCPEDAQKLSVFFVLFFCFVFLFCFFVCLFVFFFFCNTKSQKL